MKTFSKTARLKCLSESEGEDRDARGVLSEEKTEGDSH